MQVLNLLLKRRGVLYEAYRLSGESQHFYRLQEVEYLIRKCKDDQTEAQVLLDWVRGGMDLPQHVVTQALLITGDISPLSLR